jgi:flagellar basal-body rod modification protein FlgD
VTADGKISRLADGKAEWMINPARAAQASVTILDGSGNIIATSTQSVPAGSQKFTWDGRTSTGGTAPPGDYTIQITGRDASGQSVSIKTEIVGRVESVDVSEGEPVLIVGSNRVPLDKVKAVTWPSS